MINNQILGFDFAAAIKRIQCSLCGLNGTEEKQLSSSSRMAL